MSDLSALLLASLQPQTRKAAEQTLLAFCKEPNALPTLLGFVLDQSKDIAARLVASTLLKNAIKLRWFEDQDEPPIVPSEKSTIRNQLLPAMIQLSQSSSERALLNQIKAVISLVADGDFPSQWPDLVQSLASLLSPTDYRQNVCILETAHAIFNTYRSAIRTDDLYTTINLVLSQFLTPFLGLFRQTASQLVANPQQPNETVARAMSLLVILFYDLTCQDLPPEVEDAHSEFFNPTSGIFIQLLSWSPPSLLRASDDPELEPSLPSAIRTGIMEILELYINRFTELIEQTGGLQAFVAAVWNIVSTSSSSDSPISDDLMISQSLKFLATAIRCGHYKELFSSKETISRIIEDVIVPNVTLREHEVDQFEDDPMEYIRIDLAPFGAAEGSTRRQSAADTLRAFVAGNPQLTTEITQAWVAKGLEAYDANPSENWKAKDTAIYLLTAVATTGSTSRQGVTSTNALVNIIEFFGKYVYSDLETQQPAHPILQVDAIRFLHSFRNQLTKEQLLGVLPLLIRHLRSPSYVCYTYAAITIERMLFIKKDNLLLFTQADIHETAIDILTALFAKISEAGTVAEKVAENDYLMKCIMRVIITARQTLTPVYEPVLNQLISILGIMAKNPSNPNFAQYTFESISALIRFVVAGNSETLPKFENALFGPFTYILQEDVEEYVPYVFQLLSQLLELRPKSAGAIPETYTSLLPALTTPTVWQQKGSVPGLVRLLKAFLAKDAAGMHKSGQLAPVIGVLQQRLIPSKLNDTWGFELLEGVVAYVASTDLTQYYKPLIGSLLTRVQTNRTDKFAYSLARFFCFAGAVEKSNDPSFGPDYTISIVDSIQPGLWSMVLGQLVLPEIPKAVPRDRKVMAVGLTRILTRSQSMLHQSASDVWPRAFTVLINFFGSSQALESSQKDQAFFVDAETDKAVTDIDYEEQTAGYQASYSKLAASESAGFDPTVAITDPIKYFVDELQRAVTANPNLKQLIAKSDAAKLASPFIMELRRLGLAP